MPAVTRKESLRQPRRPIGPWRPTARTCPWSEPIGAPSAPSYAGDRVCTHAGRLAAVTQSISHSVGPRRATRWDLRSYTAYIREEYIIYTRARADYHTRGERLRRRGSRTSFLLSFLASDAIYPSALMLAIGTDGSANPSGRTQSRVPSRRVWRRVKVTSSSPSSLSASLVRMSWPS